MGAEHPIPQEVFMWSEDSGRTYWSGQEARDG